MKSRVCAKIAVNARNPACDQTHLCIVGQSRQSTGSRNIDSSIQTEWYRRLARVARACTGHCCLVTRDLRSGRHRSISLDRGTLSYIDHETPTTSLVVDVTVTTCRTVTRGAHSMKITYTCYNPNVRNLLSLCKLITCPGRRFANFAHFDECASRRHSTIDVYAI